MLLAFERSALLRAHEIFTFVLRGDHRPCGPSPTEAAEAAVEARKEIPLVKLNHHGYYHGIILKRLVAGYAGVPFGHEFAVLAGEAEEQPWTPPVVSIGE